MQLARDSCPLLGNGCESTLLTFAFRADGPLLRLVRLHGLPTDTERNCPDDREDDAADDEVPKTPRGSVVDHDRKDALGDGEAHKGLRPVSERADQEERRAPHDEGDAVEGDNRPVDERCRRRSDTHGRRRTERKASSGQQRKDDRQHRQFVEPQRALRSVDVLSAEDGTGDADTQHRQDHSVEPIAPRQRPKPLHDLKVLRMRECRLVRENDSKIVSEDDEESPTRPKTA